MSKMENFFNNAKDKAAEVADKAKNYDYERAAESLKEKAADITQKAKEIDYQAGIEEVKKNKGKIKKILIVAGIAILIIAVITGVFKIRKSMNLTPEDAVDNYFSIVEKSASLVDNFAELGEEDVAEVTKIIIDAIDYKIIAVDEEDTTAKVMLEIKALDIEAAMSDAYEKLSKADDDITDEKVAEITCKSIKNCKDKVEETVTMSLVKNGKRWEVSSDKEFQDVVFGTEE